MKDRENREIHILGNGPLDFHGVITQHDNICKLKTNCFFVMGNWNEGVFWRGCKLRFCRCFPGKL